MDTFFTSESIEYFSRRIKENNVYRKDEWKDASDANIFKERIYAKTNQWAEAVSLAKRYKKRFVFTPDNRWQISGYFKKYSWACLYLEEFGDQDIYYTLGVDAELESIIIKIDFDRIRSKNLTSKQIAQFDQVLAKKNIDWLIIPASEIEDKNKEWLIEKAYNFINSTLDTYKELHRMLLNDISFPSPSTTYLPQYPLNQILYGPPGTGKTYKTVDLAYRIVHNIASEVKISYEIARNWYKEELAKEDTKRQIDFITFHQNYSYEDFIMGIKPELEGQRLGFSEHEGLFFKISQRAEKNLKDSQKPIEVFKQEKKIEEIFEAFKSHIMDEIDQNEKGQFKLTESVYISEVTRDSFVYTGDNWQQKGLNMKFEDIFKIYNNANASSRKEAKITPGISGTAIQHITYFYRIASQLREFAGKVKVDNTAIEQVELKNYVIVIDEINRANISRVFGELITLIEEDKRWGNIYEMEVRLPDGKTRFRVPKNLYIIGTMNTADKSIALLDIALRRRFEFVALYPDSTQVEAECRDFFTALNEAIKVKKGIDFMIGHSYFMKREGQAFDFAKVMNAKVIPLLSEYFYNPRGGDEVKSLVNNALSKASSLSSYEAKEDNCKLIISKKDAVN